MSVLSFAHLGSSLSIRGSFPMYNMRTLSCYGALILSRQTTQNQYDELNLTDSVYIQKEDNQTEGESDTVKAYAHGGGAVSWTEYGGVLHGTWSADVFLSFSDRKLKKNIQPLHKTLQDISPGRSQADLLHELRPVSYKYKDEAKNMRFGFIADEVAETLPDIARTLPGNDEKRQGLVYQDLLAFLTSMLQGLTREMAVLTPRLASIEERIAQRKKWKRSKRARRAASAASSSGQAPPWYGKVVTV